MSIARLIAGFFVLLGLGLGAADLIVTAGEGAMRLRPLGEWWFLVDPGSLNLAQAVVQRYLTPWLWDPVILTVLTTPATAVFLILGTLIALPGVIRGEGRRSG